MIAPIRVGLRLTLCRAAKVSLSSAFARSATPCTPRMTLLYVVCASVGSPPLGFLNGWRIAGERLRQPRSVAGALADAVVRGELAHAGGVEEPAQHEYRLTVRTQRPGASAGAGAFAALVDELGQEVHRLATGFEHAGEGDRIVWDTGHAKPLGNSGSLVKTHCYQGLRLIVTDDQIVDRATRFATPLPTVIDRCAEWLCATNATGGCDVEARLMVAMLHR